MSFGDAEILGRSEEYPIFQMLIQLLCESWHVSGKNTRICESIVLTLCFAVKRRICGHATSRTSHYLVSRQNLPWTPKKVVGWFKRSLNQSIGSFSTNPHFALFQPDRRSDIFGNVSNHWGMVTYTFFWNNFFGSLIRACTGSFANVCAGTSPLYIKVGQILELSENGSWVLVDARMFFL